MEARLVTISQNHLRPKLDRFIGSADPGACYWRTGRSGSQLHKRQASLAISRELAALALRNLTVNPQLSLIQSLQAFQSADTLEAENALHQSIQAQRIIRIYPARNRRVTRVAINPMTMTLALALDSRVKIGKHLFTLPVNQYAYLVGRVVFSGDGSHLATTSAAHEACIFEIANGKKIQTIAGHTGLIGDPCLQRGFELLGCKSRDTAALDASFFRNDSVRSANRACI